MDLYSVDTKGHDYEDVWITDQVIWKWRPGNGTKAFRGTAFWGIFPLIPVLACPHKPPLCPVGTALICPFDNEPIIRLQIKATGH